ncbi:MAG: ABC-F family ATP-binding cassette domain-containing protein [Chitinophagales bacterium]
MQYLKVDNLSKRYGEKLLFEELSFVINKDEKVALIAANGTGKSSMIKALCGMEAADGGIIDFHKDIRVDFLMQEPNLNPELSILENILFSDNPATKAILDYENALLDEENFNALSNAMQKMDATNAWDYEARIKEILFKLKIFEYNKKTGVLSGGEKKRVALAKILVNEPDFLILDEPTNHLDLDMIEWLEIFLTKLKVTLLMVTHDRYFLENICNKIIELENGKIYNYSGNYSDYIVAKEARVENEKSSVLKAKNLMRTEIEWMRRSPKARGTKSKSRISSFYELEDKAKKRVEQKAIEFDVEPTRLGSKIVELHNISKSYEERTLFEKFNYKFQRFDKVGIIGVNGSGKSTFLKIMTGKLQSDTGKVVIGETIKFGLYNQEGLDLKEEKRLIEVVREKGEFIPTSGGGKITAAQLLEKFLFPRSQHFVYVSKLSGGERRRLYLLTVLIENPNFLILDEPTNDLDIITLQVLETFLAEYKGCLLIVSHDRYFMDKLVEHVFVFNENGTISDFPGNYTQYRNKLLEEKEQKKEISNKNTKKKKEEHSSVKKPQEKGSTISYEERKTFNKLEKEIEKLEVKKANIHTKMAEISTDYEKIAELQKEIRTLEEKIDEKSMLWMELGEKI